MSTGPVPEFTTTTLNLVTGGVATSVQTKLADGFHLINDVPYLVCTTLVNIESLVDDGHRHDYMMIGFVTTTGDLRYRCECGDAFTKPASKKAGES